ACSIPPPRSTTYAASRSGSVVAAADRSSVHSAVDLPDRVPPTTATLPSAPDRSTDHGSRRCSNGRSTYAIGNRQSGSRPGPAPVGSVPTATSRGAPAPSGGNHTSCARRPGPVRRATRPSSRRAEASSTAGGGGPAPPTAAGPGTGMDQDAHVRGAAPAPRGATAHHPP